jgi:uncharacterized protein with GYD domain
VARKAKLKLQKKANTMAYYMFQGAYTAEAWKRLTKKPMNRFEAITPAIEKLGGTLENGWFMFGEYDFVVIVQMPDNVNAAAFSLAVASGGSLKSSQTTPLMTVDEGLQAMKKAGTSGYRPPAK